MCCPARRVTPRPPSSDRVPLEAPPFVPPDDEKLLTSNPLGVRRVAADDPGHLATWRGELGSVRSAADDA